MELQETFTIGGHLLRIQDIMESVNDNFKIHRYRNQWISHYYASLRHYLQHSFVRHNIDIFYLAFNIICLYQHIARESLPKKVAVLPYPLYLSDLALCNHFLLRKLKITITHSQRKHCNRRNSYTRSQQ